MNARPAVPKVDSEIFRRTANHTKSVNIGRLRFRGGIRF